MTVTPGDSRPAAAGFAIPGDDAADEDVDVLYLAGQRPPADGAWLWVTTAAGRWGGKFTALFLPRDRPRASGGDVLVHIAPAAPEQGGLPAALHAGAVGQPGYQRGDRIALDYTADPHTRLQPGDLPG